MRRLPPTLLRVSVATGLAAVLFLGAGIGLGGTPWGEADQPPAAPVVDPVALSRVSTATLDSSIRALQAALRARPQDARSWATLGLAYVEQARVTGDPTYYPKAEQALDRSLASTARGNDAALTGQAALAAARHDFSRALSRADAALAVNPYSARALAVRTDALVELGRYDEASVAAARADGLRPGVPTFTRLAYLRELHGDVEGARRLLERALAAATAPPDLAYVRSQLGELARGAGALAVADAQFAEALRAVPGYAAGVAGRARVAAARGDVAAAVAGYRSLVERVPLPEHLVALGDLYTALGRTREAQEQYAVVRAGIHLARATGVGTDLEAALFESESGSPAAAVAAASAEWRRRQSIHVADALGWALHAAGRDREALVYARAATRLGTRDARLLYHRGMIERAVGRRAEARATLTAALRLDPHFSPLHAPRARAALAAALR